MKEIRLYLKFPTLEDKENVVEFKNEFLESGQNMAGVAGLDSANSYEEWLVKVEEGTKPCSIEEFVPATLFLVYRKHDNRLVGMVHIRHRLNKKLFESGGHIGDCVRPSEQGKGYATEQIGLALNKCKELGIEKVLMTCKKLNEASAKTIIKNGGVLENELIFNQEVVQRYWIELNNKHLEM